MHGVSLRDLPCAAFGLGAGESPLSTLSTAFSLSPDPDLDPSIYLFQSVPRPCAQ